MNPRSLHSALVLAAAAPLLALAGCSGSDSAGENGPGPDPTGDAAAGNDGGGEAGPTSPDGDTGGPGKPTGDAADDRGTPPPPPPTDGGNACAPPSAKSGRVVYANPGGHYWRVEAKLGGVPEDLSGGLDKLSPGSDDGLWAGPDGCFLAVKSSRFGCADNPCLAIVTSDLKSYDVVRTSAGKIYEPGFIASGGELLVFQGSGRHGVDLFATRKVGSAWSDPVPLTNDSPYASNAWPYVSIDGTKVLFNCGNGAPYGSVDGTNICEVATNGAGFRVVLNVSEWPGGAAHYYNHPGYTVDGSIVFESESPSEQIWKLAPGSKTPVLLSSNHFNDNTPCPLPNGNVASLWLGRSGNAPNDHELKVMNADGTKDDMIVINKDIVDADFTCSK